MNNLTKHLEVFLSSKITGSIFVVIISIVIFLIIRENVVEYIDRKKKNANKAKKKRLTILYMLVNTLRYLIFIIDIVIILGIFNINASAFLAGLGIFGIVIGLALQDLLKDFIAGIFIILDSQYSVGEHVSINDFEGEVVGVGLKSTKVRNYEGNIMVFNNKDISSIINYSLDNTKVQITFTFNSDENLLKLEDALEEVIKRCKDKIPDATGKLQYKGVEEYKDSKLTLKMTVNVKPTKQFSTLNIINREAKIVFDERDIKIK